MPTHLSTGRWQFWIDRGGTFTDIVAQRPTGEIVLHKLLSENPDRYPDAALQGIRDLLGIAADAPIPAAQIASVKMGTTVATNALLERQGDRTLLLITQGFRDALRIGYQHRPNIFARHIVLPDMLYERVIEVAERYSAQGEELRPVQVDDALLQAVQAAYDDGIRSCAIAFVHGYRYPQHEQQMAAIVRDIGFTQVSVSHVVSPLMKLVSRGDTTVVDAYLSPILRRYVDRVAAQLGATAASGQTPTPQLLFMQSNGGLTDAQQFQGKDSILSGPAGGIVGAVKTSAMAGFQKIIGFDMGGTSTDVSHFNGEYERTLETEVAGVRLRAPMMSIHTVAAGGGSILGFDGYRYRVGPKSAGANPGPACYRRGGPLTVTDCNVQVGKLYPDFFPSVFGPDGTLPLDVAIVHERFIALAAEIRQANGDRRTPEQIAAGFLSIAIDKMASAIKKISIQRGYDLSDYTLCCFGGAGGQHACLIAEALGMSQIFLHPYAGVLSAYGIGLADRRSLKETSVESELAAAVMPELQRILDALTAAGRAEMTNQDVEAESIQVLHRAHLRYAGTDAALVVEFGDPEVMRSRFESAYRQRYGFVMADKLLIVEALAVEVIGRTDVPMEPERTDLRTVPLQPATIVKIYTKNQWYDTPVYQRADLYPGDRISGPALVIESTGTNVIEPGWSAEFTAKGHLILHQDQHANLSALATSGSNSQTNTQASASNPPDPVLLEIFNNLVRAIAEEMGITLQNTSTSVNIKERLDFSCAVFDQHGQLVANAPHIPVHLGSMSESVTSLIRAHGETLKPGDVYVSNNPYNGGTHLPDITVITPVFLPPESLGDFLQRMYPNQPPAPNSGGSESKPPELGVGGGPGLSESEITLPLGEPVRPWFYLASRGHHADIGGITPGSMPPHSMSVEQEGVLLDNVQLVDQGRFCEADIRHRLTTAPYPVRNVEHNIADLQAQIAANARGMQELLRMVQRYGLATVQAYMQHVQDNAEACVRRAIQVLQDGDFIYPMDDGSQIQVKIQINPSDRTACIDFTGTSPQQATNRNAPLAICKAVVLYVFRTLVDDDIPLNAGCLKPLEMIVPEGCLLNPRYPAAVVAGNVETSQAIANALYGALGLLSASQGTMNSFTFGNAQHQYYETICGGSGAGPDFAGTDAVQTHMTNSRLTDPEVLEWRFPVLVENFAIRPQSGGRGQQPGGNGVIRRIQFREAMTAAILSGHRVVAPFGLAGGEPGAIGHNRVIRKGGDVEELSSNAEVAMQPGDVFVIETPGGGGFGPV